MIKIKIERIIFNIGVFFCHHFLYNFGVFFLKIDLYLCNRKNNLFGRALCNFQLGNAYSYLSKYDIAITFFKKAKNLSKNVSDKFIEAGCENNLGNIFFIKGEYKKAIICYENFFSTLEEGSIKVPLENINYQNILFACVKVDDLKKVKKYSLKLYNLFLKEKDSIMLLDLTILISDAFTLLGKYSDALEYCKKGLDIAKKLDKKEYISMLMLNIGNIYSSINENKKAKYYYENVLEILAEFKIDNRILHKQLVAINNLSIIYRRKRKYRISNYLITRVIELAEKSNDLYALGCALTNKGIIYRHLNRYDKAIEYHKRALKIDLKIKNRLGSARCYGNLGIAYYDKRSRKEALHYIIKSIKLSREIGDLNNETIVTKYMVSILMELYNKPYLAYVFCKHNIDISEILKSDLFLEEHKMRITSKIIYTYYEMIQICLRMNKITEAFNYLERMKSRTLLELLSRKKIVPKAKVGKDFRILLDSENEYLKKINEINYRISNNMNITEISELKNINIQLNKIYQKMKVYDLGYALLRSGENATYEEIRKKLSSSNNRIKIVEYCIIDNKLRIFILSNDSVKIELEEVDISYKELREHSYEYWLGATNRKPIDNAWFNNEKIISQIFINPLKNYLVPGDYIYFVPHDFMHYLPLHALKINNIPIIENFSISYLPSASVLQFINFNKKVKYNNNVFFGVAYSKKLGERLDEAHKTELKKIELEAKEIGNIFNMEAFLNKEAIKEKVKLSCKNKDIIHFSCHGNFDRDDPFMSGISIYDGLLSAKDILSNSDMFYNSELVVLSACETGFNKLLLGDELIGLSRSILYAGANSLILTLWSVNIDSTKEFMIEFYKNIKSGKNKSSALREAQLKIKEKYNSPYYWAPFILIGNYN